MCCFSTARGRAHRVVRLHPRADRRLPCRRSHRYPRRTQRRAAPISDQLHYAGGYVHNPATDRKSVVKGKSVLVRLDLGGRRIINKKKSTNNNTTQGQQKQDRSPNKTTT